MPGPEAAPRKPIYKDLLLLQLAALVFLLDQFSKFLVREFLDFRESYPLEGFFRFTHTHNTGSAFGILQDQNTPLILVSLIGIGVLALIYHSQRQPTNLLRLSLGLQMGGASGNLIDRVLLDHVTDFIDVGTWPVFNIADSSIVVGLALLAWLYLRPERFGGVGPSATVYDRCPICDGEMLAAGKGWHCSGCGVRERIDVGYGFPEDTVAAEERGKWRDTRLIPAAPPGVVNAPTVQPALAESSFDLTSIHVPETESGVVDSRGDYSYPGDTPGDEPEDQRDSLGTSRPP
ncbi:MAG: signal peptidase II [SAR202 cluster bacterium Io17-Chloro-G9]|nr:MAG: signal peptidase II [SAR202 cluster bacterium Io17-Chloro-G9]